MSSDPETPEVPDEVVTLAAQLFHWTYHRRSACQCELDDEDLSQGRVFAEALWSLGYRAGRGLT